MKKCMLFLLLIMHCINGQVKNDTFILITMLYNETNPQRCQEYICCLEKNLEHPLIEKIHVLYDTAKDMHATTDLLDFIKSKDIVITYTRGRATYQNFFDVANSLYSNRRIIVSNADIFFNETLFKLIDYDLTNQFLALTRWEINKDGTLRKPYGTYGAPLYCSQDTWIFNTPIRQFQNAHIQLGILGCDGTIAKQALMAGLKVSNPCLTIQCCHLHFTNIHHYPKEAYPPSGYYDVKWSYLE